MRGVYRRPGGGPAVGFEPGGCVQNPGHRGEKRRPLCVCVAGKPGAGPEKSRLPGGGEVPGNAPCERFAFCHRVYPGRLHGLGDEKTVPYSGGPERPGEGGHICKRRQAGRAAAAGPGRPGESGQRHVGRRDRERLHARGPRQGKGLVQMAWKKDTRAGKLRCPFFSCEERAPRFGRGALLVL